MDSDPDIEIIDKDSGMSSMGGSKDDTPERRAVIVCIFPRYLYISCNVLRLMALMLCIGFVGGLR